MNQEAERAALSSFALQPSWLPWIPIQWVRALLVARPEPAWASNLSYRAASAPESINPA